MSTTASVITLIIIGVYLALFAYLIGVRPPSNRPGRNGLLASVVLAAAAGIIYLTSLSPVFSILALIGAFGAFGYIAIQDANPTAERLGRSWVGLCIVWAAALGLAALLGESFVAGTDEWLTQADASGVIFLLGLGISTFVLLAIGLRGYYAAQIPEVANRNMFWVLASALMAVGLLLTSLPALAFTGLAAMLISLGGAAYAVRTYRVFDIRGNLFQVLRAISFVGLAGGLIFTSLYLVVSTDTNTNAEGLLLMGIVAVLVAAVYVPIRQVSEYFVRQLELRTRPDPTQATKEYSQAVSQAVELDRLVPLATSALNHVMQVRYSCLILLNSTVKVKNAVELLVLYPGETEKITGFVNIYSPIYNALAAERKPLSQFDIEYAPQYQEAAAAERDFFRNLQMSAYAPIVLENVLVGLVACGRKLDGSAFYKHDLELLATLAQQTSVAIRNARLVEDLQHLNNSTRSLNKALKKTNEQLSRLDSVKTDFVTIASHELRTPLAQVRGYTDIADALNEQGMLDQDQTTNMINNLRKATERMEELIAAMLDVSQLDTDAMDLHLTETSIESVLRMAIEPLQEAIIQRKLGLTARGLKGLPTLQADLQRLVQACRNVIVNSIKFTPDGGKIDITAEIQPAHSPEAPDNILIKISDTGVGIDQHNLEMIFKKFFRAYDPSLHSTGTYKFLGAGPGLGLTIARGVIEGHGGKIWAESNEHDMESFPGATFYILLPVTTPETARRILTFEGEASEKALARA